MGLRVLEGGLKGFTRTHVLQANLHRQWAPAEGEPGSRPGRFVKPSSSRGRTVFGGQGYFGVS